jgi:hypothetical protein
MSRLISHEGYVLVDALVALALSAIIVLSGQIAVSSLTTLYQRLDEGARYREAVLRARLALEGAVSRAHAAMSPARPAYIFAGEALDLENGKWSAAGLISIRLERPRRDGQQLVGFFGEDPGKGRIILDQAGFLNLKAFPTDLPGVRQAGTRVPGLPDLLLVEIQSGRAARDFLYIPLPAFDDPRCTAAPFEERCLRR